MNERSIFIEALQRDAPSQRTAYLDEACGNDSALRQRVEALLSRHGKTDSLLDSPARELVAIVDQCATEGPGTVIGRYKLQERIGEGGFGVVYMAEQTEPVCRQVALKVIKLGMDTEQVIARFEAERQALAMMDHPNIAKVLDAGASDSGRPYFVMELVRGDPITEYCDEARLTTRERIELFIDVCHAVQHAHLKGIIHRDIKPTNLLVTPYDGRTVPKVIDFGIAKAIHHRLTEKTFSTGCGRLIGTPQYMSPEQAELSDVDVDTRTDVHSLGVLLYELLTGTTPIEADELGHAGYDEVCRIIRETDPPVPSKRLSTLKDATTEVAKHRKTQPAVLRKLLRGDLDRIVMKAVERDRTDRYASPQDMADDLRRFLEDKPIRAHLATFLERMIRKSRRHRAAVVTAGIVLPIEGEADAFISKYDATGTLEWTHQLGTSDYDFSYDVSADGLGNVIISGSTQGNLGGPNSGKADAFVARITEPLLGDVNLDGVVNGLDVDPFVELLLNGTDDNATQVVADMNSDGEVNGLDVDPFVATVVGGVQPIPEPSTLLLAIVALGMVGGWRKWGG